MSDICKIFIDIDCYNQKDDVYRSRVTDICKIYTVGVKHRRNGSLYILYKEQKQRAINIIESLNADNVPRALDNKASVKVSSKSLEKCRSSCAQKELFTIYSI
jgi:flagellar biosynthesis/type III secretory pathway M-ring protein FliF/YscJ